MFTASMTKASLATPSTSTSEAMPILVPPPFRVERLGVRYVLFRSGVRVAVVKTVRAVLLAIQFFSHGR